MQAALICVTLLFTTAGALKLISFMEPHIGQYRNDAYMPIQGPFKDKFFGAMSLTGMLWDKAPGVTFNPSLVPLPPKGGNTTQKKAHFAAVLRTVNGQCKNLGTGETQARAGFDDQGTIFALFDEALQFHSMAELKLELESGQNRFGAQDARLALENSEVLIDYMTYGKKRLWHLHRLELTYLADGKVVATKGSLANAFPGLPAEKTYQDARNLGLLNHENKPYIVWSASTTDVDVRQMSGASLAKKKKKKKDSLSMHLSGTPIHIPEKSAYLTVLHKHGPRGKHGARYGSEYWQYLALMEDQPPFRLKGLSAPFCIPSLDPAHADDCEIIQFVGSITRDPQDLQTLIIAYGINDCEAAVVRLPLEEALKSIPTYPTNLGSELMEIVPMDEFQDESVRNQTWIQ